MLITTISMSTLQSYLNDAGMSSSGRAESETHEMRGRVGSKRRHGTLFAETKKRGGQTVTVEGGWRDDEDRW